MKTYDVTVIGGGPAGLAAALSAEKHGAEVLLIEREARLGGVLKQCVHDGFGVLRFGEKLSGCEYATRFLREIEKAKAEILCRTFASDIKESENGFHLTLIMREGVREIETKTLILATGCRERTARQVSIHGTKPAGIFTAGSAQYYLNVMGQMPGRRCVILGSGDIGLIMARRLTLEGAIVEGVYEAKPSPSGLTRNIYQCLYDFDIPLHLSHTVTKVSGDARVTAVTVAQVDEKMQPIPGTEREIACDTLIVSVGLIPENELAELLSIPVDPRTKGALCDNRYMTMQDGVFSCGNALHVNDLVDYVSESGEAAGRNAARFRPRARVLVPVDVGNGFLYAVPQVIDISDLDEETPVFFRASSEFGRSRVRLLLDGKEILQKNYLSLRPPEMERLAVGLRECELFPDSRFTLCLEGEPL